MGDFNPPFYLSPEMQDEIPRPTTEDEMSEAVARHPDEPDSALAGKEELIYGR
jgi:hypothetical protein